MMCWKCRQKDDLLGFHLIFDRLIHTMKGKAAFKMFLVFVKKNSSCKVYEYEQLSNQVSILIFILLVMSVIAVLSFGENLHHC